MDCSTPVSTTTTTRGGTLESNALLGVLSDLLEDRLTGLLTLERSAHRVTLRFVNGDIVGVPAGAAAPIGEILIDRGLLTRSDLGRGLAQARSQGRRLGLVVCEMGLLRRESLEQALQFQLDQTLSAVLAWEEGTYDFVPDDGPGSLDEDVTLRVSTRELLCDAGRRREAPEPAPDVVDLREQLEKAIAKVSGRNHFEILSVLGQAGPVEILEACRRLGRRYHPDTLRDPALADLREAAAAVFQDVTEAYSALRVLEPVATRELPLLRPLDELLRSGEDYLREGRLWEASSALEELVMRSEGRLNQRARLLLASAHAQTRSGKKQAESELIGLIAEDDTLAEAHLALAELYKSTDLNRHAATACRNAIGF